MPIPIYDPEYEASGLTMMYPEEAYDGSSPLPSTGGIMGTVKSVFRAFGFARSKEEIKNEEPVSKSTARKKRGTGLYGDQNG